MDVRAHDPITVVTPQATTITALFRAQAARTPQAPALESAGRCFSYAELDSWSDGLAQRFVAAGVNRGDLVGIRGVRCGESVAALLGILKAGAAYLPLNPSDPPSRLRRILEDAAPVAVVDPDQGGHSGIPFTGPVLNVAHFEGDYVPALSADFADGIGEDLAYVCYTSGSTGQPKGVMIPHRGVARLVRNTNYIDIRPDDVFLQLAPLSFDASTFEIWGALLNGAKLAVYEADRIEFSDLGRFIREKNISTLWLTSALFNRMVDCELDRLLGVRTLLAGGDTLSVQHVKKLLGRMPPGHVLINGYGPTENTTFTCCHRMDRDSVIHSRVPIGIPVTGTHVVIVDEQGRPVPAHAAGEILVGGSGLARGYLNSPALDAEKFVSLAIGGVERCRFYRTGDLGVWNPDGTLDFRGRMDDQIKVRGFRIEPGEIEAALRGLKGVRDAAVTVDEGEPGDRQILAFVVRDDTRRGAAAINAELQSFLPDYMVPAGVHFLDGLPVTPNGKTDRAALRELAADGESGSAAHAGKEPRDLLEHRLAAIWCRLFGRKHIGRDANFFELGGHSLLAAQLAYEVEKLVGRRLPIGVFFHAQTIADLAAMIQAEECAPEWSSLVPLRPEGEKAPLFLIHGYGGDVYGFLDLARAIERGRPVYGVQAVGIDGRRPHHETMEVMAEHYAREIRSLQPQGPYHLAGYSLGGWIAYAVAQELQGGGQEVAFLGLFDTGASANVAWYHYYLFLAPELALRALRKIRQFRRVPADAKAGYLAAPLRMLWYLLTRSRSQIGAYAREQGWEADRYDALHASYCPKTYRGSAAVFLASEGPKGDEPRIIRSTEAAITRFFWRFMVRGGVRFHQVSGDHHAMLSGDNAWRVASAIEVGVDKAVLDSPRREGSSLDSDSMTVVDLFEDRARKAPDAVAVESGEGCLTYRELDSRADHLAEVLAAAGVGPDKVVGIYAPMSPAVLVGLVAILKAGAAYLPIDLALPRARRAFLLRDARCQVLLARAEDTAELLEDLQREGLAPRIVTLASVGHATPATAKLARVVPARPENLAYVLYTSGSTGRPKGVEMPHRALVNLLRWQESISSEGKSGRTLQFASLGFDVSFQEIFATWLSGGTLVLVDGVVRRDWEKLLQFIDQRKINRLFLPFVVLENIAAAAARCGIVPASVKEVFVAGEQLRIGSDIRRLFSRLRGARLWNHYGPTETHVVTGFMLDGDPEEWPDLPPIGKPVPNCEIRLLDETMRPVPAGVPAELYISGLPLARGYRNSPELTAERFLPSWKSPHEKMYKTGDVARLNPDGTFEFVGRSDFQVKIRGHRIELGEIEAILGKYPHIANCAVMVEEGPVGKQLVAFVVPRDRAVLSLASLRGVLSAELPDYMIPTRFVLLPALPLTPNGKVDREALGQAKGSEVSTGAEQTAPRHELEHRLAEIWKSLLSRRHVGVHDNFFELGGNSLLVAFCCAEIERQVGIRVPLGTFFEHSTIAGLSEKLRSLPTGVVVMPVAGHNTAPLACFAQESMWFLQQYLPDAATYNQPLAWHFSGLVDEEKLRVSLEEIMSRHEILRTALVYEEGYLVQRISRPEHSKVPWRQVLFESQSAADDCLCAEARRPFDLAIGPLWRCLWIETSRDDHILLLVFHHSIIDEWSMRLLVAELETIYAGKAPDELRLQFADYAAWERRGLAGTRLDIGSAYWRRQLVDIPPPLKWPSASGQPKRPTGGGLTQSFRLDASVVAKLRPLAREEGTTVFVVMLAAFQLWLHINSGRDDIIVGTPFAERSRAEVQPLIGCFLNTVPIRTKFVKDESFRDLLRRVRGSALAAFDHADFPFAKMVELAVSQRGTAGASLFQTMFVLLEQSVPAPRLGDAVSRTRPVETGTAKFDLTLFINAEGETWDCRLEYSTDLFSSADAAQMAGEMVQLFGALAENPSFALH